MVLGTLTRVSDTAAPQTHTIHCPHCKKQFEASLLEGAAERYRGFKCPHCRLFVPAERVDVEDVDDA
jgi:DNA-directed RNA polymerase subunit RPC12/RpoP